MSETRVERCVSKGKIILALFVLKKGEEETTLHALDQPIIHEFNDVFPNDPALRLPPVIGIEHHINLFPKLPFQTS